MPDCLPTYVDYPFSRRRVLLGGVIMLSMILLATAICQFDTSWHWTVFWMWFVAGVAFICCLAVFAYRYRRVRREAFSNGIAIEAIVQKWLFDRGNNLEVTASYRLGGQDITSRSWVQPNLKLPIRNGTKMRIRVHPIRNYVWVRDESPIIQGSDATALPASIEDANLSSRPRRS